ncbi:hypothetical protein K1T71_011378 [Dendrolimus kikuchii]|uniref:Uncharacterized protein n=1 Tax=Dendrolimus kikuchii TaxID=765133 RepID=A0ACC1CP05_9NEOP|nr:hypothetical protein K1T71_011378 [Dendrolimus kikuchii]
MKDLNDIILRNIGVLALLFVNGQRAQSPCPGIFDYQRDGNITYGLVHLEPTVPVPQLVIQAYFTIPGQVPSTNLGSFEPLGGSDLNRTINPGEVVSLRVHFPVIKPLPRLITLTVNNEPICYGPEERPPPDQAVTVINLEYNAALPPKPPAPLPIANPDESSASCLQSSDRIGETSKSLEDVCGIVPLKMAVPHILQGESYPRGDWPWVVAVFIQKKFNLRFRCVGMLISKHHVISSVFCIEDPKRKGSYFLPGEMLVKVGAYDLYDLTEEYTVAVGIRNYTIHDDYHPKVFKNDIVVFTLMKDLLFNDYVRPVCLWSEATKEQKNVIGRVGVVAGWSRNVNNGTKPEEPSQGKFLIVSTEDCRASSHVDFDHLTRDTTLCAGYRNGTGICEGDWGAGMYLREKGDPKWRLRALASAGINSGDGFYCNVQQYVIFTDLAQYLPWIKNIMATT